MTFEQFHDENSQPLKEQKKDLVLYTILYQRIIYKNTLPSGDRFNYYVHSHYFAPSDVVM